MKALFQKFELKAGYELHIERTPAEAIAILVLHQASAGVDMEVVHLVIDPGADDKLNKLSQAVGQIMSCVFGNANADGAVWGQIWKAIHKFFPKEIYEAPKRKGEPTKAERGERGDAGSQLGLGLPTEEQASQEALDAISAKPSPDCPF